MWVERKEWSEEILASVIIPLLLFSIFLIPASQSVLGNPTVKGIDVSDHQHYVSVRGKRGKIAVPIDWSEVYKQGYRFAFVKATQGTTYVNEPFFYEDMISGKNAGLLMGAYHFAEPNLYLNGEELIKDAEEEARHFINVAQDYLKEGYLRPALDIENATKEHPTWGVHYYNPSTGEIIWEIDEIAKKLGLEETRKRLSTWINKWMEIVGGKIDTEPILYVNHNFAAHYLDKSLSKYPLWFAWPTNQPDNPPDPSFLGIWETRGWDFWQYSWKGSVPGIKTSVPLDLFNGDMSRLCTFVISKKIAPILDLSISGTARVVDYDKGIYVVGTSDGDLYIINEAGEYAATHLGDFMISDVRIKNPFIVVAANHIYSKGEYWYDTHHYRYAYFDYGYVIKFTLPGIKFTPPREEWRTRIDGWGYWYEESWDGLSNTYQNFALPSVDLSSDGGYVAYLSHDYVGVLRGSDGKSMASYSISGAWIVSWLDATDDMKYIAITAEVGPYYGGENTGVELYRFDGTSLNRVWGTILIYRYETTEVKISEDKRYVAVATSSGTEMNLLDLATGSILWRYDAVQEQFAVDGDRNLNYIIGATQYDPSVSPSPPYKWFILRNLGTNYEVLAEGNMKGSINDLDSNDDASLLAFGSDAGEFILFTRSGNAVRKVLEGNVGKLIDAIEIGRITLLIGGDGFIRLYSIAGRR